jgi:hypothetical protein
MRGLAHWAGIGTLTIYSYLDSKLARFDAKFSHAAQVFAKAVDEPPDVLELGALPRLQRHRYLNFYPANVARHHLQNA